MILLKPLNDVGEGRGYFLGGGGGGAPMKAKGRGCSSEILN